MNKKQIKKLETMEHKMLGKQFAKVGQIWAKKKTAKKNIEGA